MTLTVILLAALQAQCVAGAVQQITPNLLNRASAIRETLRIAFDRKEPSAYLDWRLGETPRVVFGTRFAASLTPTEMEGVIGHEIAHMIVTWNIDCGMQFKEMQCDLISAEWLQWKGYDGYAITIAMLMKTDRDGGDAHPPRQTRINFLTDQRATLDRKMSFYRALNNLNFNIGLATNVYTVLR